MEATFDFIKNFYRPILITIVIPLIGWLLISLFRSIEYGIKLNNEEIKNVSNKMDQYFIDPLD